MYKIPINLFTISLLFLCCKGKETKEPILKNQIDCTKAYASFNKKVINKENDSAIFYINKAINCDTTNSKYKFSKVKFLTDLKKYDDAIVTLDLLISPNEPSFKMLKGILKLKANNSDSEKFLKESYVEFKEIKNPSSNNLFYKIALDNYFEGKKFALNEIKKYRNLYSSPYEKQNIDYLEELISTKNKNEVLYGLFNIH